MLKGGIEFNDNDEVGRRPNDQFQKFPRPAPPARVHLQGRETPRKWGSAEPWRATGAYPANDLFLAAKVDEISGAVEDIRRRSCPRCWSPTRRSARDAQAAQREWASADAGHLEGLLAANQKSIAGSKLGFAVGDFRSIADFSIGVIQRWVACEYLDGVDPKTVTKYKHIMAICAAINADEEIKAFREKCGLPTEVA